MVLLSIYELLQSLSLRMLLAGELGKERLVGMEKGLFTWEVHTAVAVIHGKSKH